MNITQLLGRFVGTGSSLTNNVLLIDFCGGNHAEAQWLSQMIYWSSRSTLEGGWFAKTYAALHEEVRVSERSARRFNNKYEKLNLLEREVRHWQGKPTVHYRMNTALLLSELTLLVEEQTARAQVEETVGEEEGSSAPAGSSSAAPVERNIAVWQQMLENDEERLSIIAMQQQCTVEEVRQVVALFVQDKQFLGEDAKWKNYNDMRHHFYNWSKSPGVNISEKVKPANHGANSQRKKGLYANGHVIDPGGAHEVLAGLRADRK